MNPATLRADVPALQHCCYLNTGASGPSPTQVVEAANEFQRRQQFDAPCGEGMYEAGFDATASAREAIASHLGTVPESIALTNNTVEGINHVATGLDWEEGDVIARTDLEHGAGMLPWQRMRDRYGVEVRTLETETGHLDLDAVKEAVQEARLLCLSSLSWNYGTRLPVSDVVDIAHDADTQVLVDAVQSVGQAKMDVEEWGADFVAASGHKWSLGLWGSGIFYVSQDALETLSPDRIGYFSVTGKTEEGYEFYPDARRFELGTRPIAPHVALETALDLLESIGMDTIEQHVARLTDRLNEGLGDRLLTPRDARSGIVTFDADDPEALVEALSNEGIQIRWVPDPYACRASVHVYNTAEDVDRLLDALGES